MGNTPGDDYHVLDCNSAAAPGTKKGKRWLVLQATWQLVQGMEYVPDHALVSDQCQNQWRNGVLGNVQFPHTQWLSFAWVMG